MIDRFIHWHFGSNIETPQSRKVKEAGLEGWATHLPPWAGQDLHVIFFLQLAKHIWYSTGSSFVRPSDGQPLAKVSSFVLQIGRLIVIKAGRIVYLIAPTT